MLFSVYQPVAFTIFGLEIRWYAICIITGIFAAIFFATVFTKYRKGLKKEYILDAALAAVPLGVLGARVFSVLTDPNQEKTLAQIFNFSSGGLSIIGAIIGGAVGLLIVCAIRKINPFKFLDIIVPCLLLAQGIGRWGNFANQEVYGMMVPENMQWFPFAVFIERGGLNEWRHALFFYEFLWNILGFVLLYLCLRKIKKEGIVGLGYFFWYGLGRSLMEGMRDPEFNLGTNVMISRVFSIGMAVIGVVGIIVLLILDKRKKPAPASAMAAASGDTETVKWTPVDTHAEAIAELAIKTETAPDTEEKPVEEAEKEIQETPAAKTETAEETPAEAPAAEKAPQTARQAKSEEIRLTEKVVVPEGFVPDARIVDQDEIDRLSAELDAIEKSYIRVRTGPRTRPVVPPPDVEKPKAVKPAAAKKPTAARSASAKPVTAKKPAATRATPAAKPAGVKTATVAKTTTAAKAPSTKTTVKKAPTKPAVKKDEE